MKQYGRNMGQSTIFQIAFCDMSLTIELKIVYLTI